MNTKLKEMGKMKNVTKRLIGLGLIFAGSLFFGSSANAATISFTDDFNDGILDPHLEDVSGAFTESGGVIGNASGLRRYIRTVDTDFNNTAGFVAEIDINMLTTSNDIAFFGFGPGSPDPGSTDEPLGATFRIHSSTNVSGRLDVAAITTPSGGFSFLDFGIGNPGNGNHRARITFDGLDTLLFDYDEDYSGVFTSDFSSLITLSSLGFDASNSRLFFGSSGFSGTTFDNLSISVTPLAAVPVPAAVWLFGSGLLGLVGVARRKQAAKTI